MYCQNCGQQIASNVKFCNFCGNRQEEVEVEKQVSRTKVTISKNEKVPPPRATISNYLTIITIGAVGTLLASYVFYLISRYIELELHTFSLLFIIPFGGVLIGCAATAGLGLVSRHFRPLPKLFGYVFALILGIIGFLGIYAFQYANTTYKGEHISAYEIDGTQVTFTKYMDLMLNTPQDQYVKFGRRVRQADFQSSPGMNKYGFYSNLVVSAIGALGVASMIYADPEKQRIKHHTER